MRDDASWFAHWEDELPSPEELMPLSQTLITPDLAAAFDISTTTAANISDSPSQPSPAPPASAPRPASSAGDDFDSSSGAGDEPARTLKRPRLVWTPQLHKRFVDAVAHLGIKNAVPKTIMQLMNVDGLTRENVASHLQKYRLYLKRMQGLSAGSDGSPAGPPSAIDHLFASTPIPPHHHYENHHLLPFVPIGFNSPAATAAHHHHFVGGPPPPPAGYPAFDHRYLTRQPLVHHGLAPPPPPAGLVMSKTREFRGVEDELGSESTTPTTRMVLTLFPTGDD